MAYDSGGQASVTGNRAVTGQTIQADQLNVPLADIQSMLSQVLLRSGVAPMVGNLNLNGFKATGAGDPTNDGDLVSLSYLKTLIDPWALQPIGAFIAYDAGEGLTPPPKNNSLYRYALLSSGQTGAGLYNEGILTSETVSGTNPTVIATAVVSLTGSPLNGKTIRLINTERRFIRAGAAGSLQESQNASHDHTVIDPGHGHTLGVNVPLPGADTDRGSGSSLFSVDAFQANAPVNSAFTGITVDSQGGTEARTRNLGVTYYRRIL